MGQSIGSYEIYWSEYVKGLPENREFLLAQIRPLLYTMPMPIAASILAGAPGDVKRMLWREWAGTVDLSGYTVDGITKALKTEPVSAIYEIVKAWLSVADLAQYDLRGVLEIDEFLTTKQDKLTLWQRWVKVADFTIYDLTYFAGKIKTLCPEICRIAYCAWVWANDTSAYPYSHLARVGRMLPTNVVKAGNDIIRLKHRNAQESVIYA